METLSSTPYLLVDADKAQRPLPLAGTNRWIVGRSKHSDVLLLEQSVSRRHALLHCTESGDIYLIDLGSRNGSFVNGQRVILPVTLQDGDRLTFGNSKLAFHRPQTEPQSSSDGTNSSVFFKRVRCLISVLVVDIRNFKALTQQVDGKILSKVIGTWFREAETIIRHYDGWVDRYVGDAIVAVWCHHPQNVNIEEVQNICETISALYAMTSALNQQYPLPFSLPIGVGVNTGYAMVDSDASHEDHLEYTALGNTVKKAFNLEAASKKIGLDIALGETLYQYFQDSGMGEEVFTKMTVELKGGEKATSFYGGSFANLDAFLHKN
ncbi:MAG: adenylate/guanylate cyclase domain-containing protein [Kastovskya adunca ATA6-11-RM4]|nr:adenylate/guanylate cyclase domain-containing protein [Kastovskya adunca ATA6-11-RM4]